MKKNLQAETARPSRLRVVALLGLMVLIMLFAPLGQGVGLSAGQGQVSAAAPSVAANALAAREVERILVQE